MSDHQHDNHGEHHGDHGQHHENNNEHNNAHEAPAAAPVKEVAPEPVAAPEAKPTTRKAAPARRTANKGGELTWAEVEAIIEFNSKFESASAINQSKALSVFGLPEDSTSISLAQALRPSGGKIWAFETYSKIARKVQGGNLGFMDALKIIEEFTTSTPDDLKTFDNVVAAFTGEGQYRKNIAITDYVQTVIGSIKPDQVDTVTFDFIDGLLAVWPGEYA